MDQIVSQIIDAIEASVYWKDLSGRYLGCNLYMSKMAGLARHEIIGNTDYLLPWKNQANQIREIDQLVVKNKRKYELEESATLATGVNKIFLSSKSSRHRMIFDLTENDSILCSIK